jgi:hypothetical protein
MPCRPQSTHSMMHARSCSAGTMARSARHGRVGPSLAAAMLEAGSMDAGREAGTSDAGGRRADAPLRAQARERGGERRSGR